MAVSQELCQAQGPDSNWEASEKRRPSALNSRLARWLRGKEPAHQCQRCRRHRFNPWVGKIPWRRKWQPTLVFLPAESHGQRSLVSYSPWGRQELDKTEVTKHNRQRVKKHFTLSYKKTKCMNLFFPKSLLILSKYSIIQTLKQEQRFSRLFMQL